MGQGKMCLPCLPSGRVVLVSLVLSEGSEDIWVVANVGCG